MNRKKWMCLLLGLPLVLVRPAVCQVTVELVLPAHQVMVYEPIKARVTVRNDSGHAMTFGDGKTSARLSFDLEQTGGRLAKRQGKGSVLSDEQLMSGEVKTFELDLARLYALNSPVPCKVSAIIEWGGAMYASSRTYLEIVKGSELAQLSTGVPSDPSATRRYVLEYAQKADGEYLFLRVEDPAAREVYGVCNLGRVIRTKRPDLQVDEVGNVHVLFQTVSSVFIHASYTPHAVFLFAKNYTGLIGQVALVRSPNGQVTVSKGQEMGVPPSTNSMALDAESERALRKKVSKTGGLFGKPALDPEPAKTEE